MAAAAESRGSRLVQHRPRAPSDRHRGVPPPSHGPPASRVRDAPGLLKGRLADGNPRVPCARRGHAFRAMCFGRCADRAAGHLRCAFGRGGHAVVCPFLSGPSLFSLRPSVRPFVLPPVFCRAVLFVRCADRCGWRCVRCILLSSDASLPPVPGSNHDRPLVSCRHRHARAWRGDALRWRCAGRSWQSARCVPRGGLPPLVFVRPSLFSLRPSLSPFLPSSLSVRCFSCVSYADRVVGDV